MIELIGLMAAFALIGLALMIGVMVIVGGLRFDDVRDLVLHDAYRSFTFEGDRIPGLKPGFWARLAIRMLSEPDDGRLRLVPEVRLERSARPVFDRLAVADTELANWAVFRAR